MCEPATLAMMAFGMSAASSVVSYQGQSAAAKAQAASVKRAGELEQMDNQRLLGQQGEEGADRMNAAAMAAQAELASLDAIAGEYGGGKSVDRAAAVHDVQRGNELATIRRNATNAISETAFSGNAARERTRGQLASIRKPSLLGTALEIGGAGVSAYAGYKRDTKPKGP